MCQSDQLINIKRLINKQIQKNKSLFQTYYNQRMLGKKLLFKVYINGILILNASLIFRVVCLQPLQYRRFEYKKTSPSFSYKGTLVETNTDYISGTGHPPIFHLSKIKMQHYATVIRLGNLIAYPFRKNFNQMKKQFSKLTKIILFIALVA